MARSEDIVDGLLRYGLLAVAFIMVVYLEAGQQSSQAVEARKLLTDKGYKVTSLEYQFGGCFGKGRRAFAYATSDNHHGYVCVGGFVDPVINAQ